MASLKVREQGSNGVSANEEDAMMVPMEVREQSPDGASAMAQRKGEGSNG